MTSGDLRQRFRSLNVWEQEGRRAPHKPLLVLLAIGRCLRGEDRLIPFTLVRRELPALLRSFGPHRRVVHPEFPFWRLRNDGVWQVEREDEVRVGPGGDAHTSSLTALGIRGGLLQDDHEALRNDPTLALDVAESLLYSHFPETLHAGILDAVGFPPDILEAPGIVPPARADAAVRFGEHYVRDAPRLDDHEVLRRRRRDPAFHAAVIEAYGGRCAVCEFAVRVQDSPPLALEAAHIRWHSAAGPNDVPNGLALCSLHHKLFDHGAFTVRPGLEVSVAEGVAGEGFDEALGQFDEKPLRAPPRRRPDRPGPEFLCWHAREVFKSPPAAGRQA